MRTWKPGTRNQRQESPGTRRTEPTHRERGIRNGAPGSKTDDSEYSRFAILRESRDRPRAPDRLLHLLVEPAPSLDLLGTTLRLGQGRRTRKGLCESCPADPDPALRLRRGAVGRRAGPES